MLSKDRTARAEALTTTYVQQVPDHCDRITWRGSYFHLPIATPQASATVPEEWRHALLALADRIEEADEQPIAVSRNGADILRALLAASAPE